MKPLGKTQASILEALTEHKGWTLNCGWMWSTMKATERVIKRLVELGYATSFTDEKGRVHYRAKEKPK